MPPAMPAECCTPPNLAQRLTASGDFTHASALAFLVFILLYFPCIATVAAIGCRGIFGGYSRI